jgi:hypothetical protein
MRSRSWLVAVMLGASASAFAQDQAFMIPNDREASAQVASILASARDAGLPTKPIVIKVSYGVNAMRSKPNDIVRAASIVKTRLEAARTALAPNPSEQEITEGAIALAEEGATVAMLRSVRKAGGNRSLVAALGLLTQLLATKSVTPPRAIEIVTDLLRREVTPGQLVTLGNDIASDVLVGSQLASSVDVRLHNLIATLAAPNGAASATSADRANLGAGGETKTTSATPPPPPPRRP